MSLICYLLPPLLTCDWQMADGMDSSHWMLSRWRGWIFHNWWVSIRNSFLEAWSYYLRLFQESVAIPVFSIRKFRNKSTKYVNQSWKIRAQMRHNFGAKRQVPCPHHPDMRPGDHTSISQHFINNSEWCFAVFLRFGCVLFSFRQTKPWVDPMTLTITRKNIKLKYNFSSPLYLSKPSPANHRNSNKKNDFIWIILQTVLNNYTMLMMFLSC